MSAAIAEAAAAGAFGDIVITDETIALVKEVAAGGMRSINLATGLQGYDLHKPAQVVVPVITPVVNSLPRADSVGIDVHHFKAITSFGWEAAGSPPGVVDENQNPSAPSYVVQQYYNIFQTIGTSNDVSFKAQWRGRSLEGNVREKRVAELLYILKIIEEQWLIYYSDYLPILPTPLAPTTAASGGSIAAGTYYVGVTARTANGETPVSVAAATIVTTGTTSTISVTWFTTPLATGYNLYMGTAPGNLLQVAVANIQGATGNVGTTGAVTQTVPNLAGNMSATITAPGAGPNPPATNGAMVSKGANNLPLTFNGIIGLLAGGGNTAYSGLNQAPTSAFSLAGPSSKALVNSGSLGELSMKALVAQPASAAGTLAYSDITNMLLGMFQNARANPDFMAVSPQDNTTVTNLLVNQAGTRINISANIPDALGNLRLGTRVTSMLNPTTGKVVDVEIWPYLPQGTIVFGSRTLPYPIPGFDGPPIQVLVNQDYYSQEYAPTKQNPQFSWADFVDETLKISFLGGFGLLTGIIPS